jgi:hypothetical protein
MAANFNLTFTALNVNSMNVSTLGSRNAKTYVKIEGLTSKKADVIFITDVRAKDKGEELKKMMGLTRNGSYKLYLNSTRESRRNISQDIRGICRDARN